jgi:hypothetical protein
MDLTIDLELFRYRGSNNSDGRNDTTPASPNASAACIPAKRNLINKEGRA